MVSTLKTSDEGTADSKTATLASFSAIWVTVPWSSRNVGPTGKRGLAKDEPVGPRPKLSIAVGPSPVPSSAPVNKAPLLHGLDTKADLMAPSLEKPYEGFSFVQ